MVASVLNHSRIIVPGSKCGMTFCEEFAARLIPLAWPMVEKGENRSLEESQSVDLGTEPAPRLAPNSEMCALDQLLDKFLFLPRVQTDHCVRWRVKMKIEL
jgi:hypothetical protein